MSNWWGPQDFEEDQTMRWQIGPRDLWVTRADREWRVATRLLLSERERLSAPPAPSDPPPNDPDVHVRRYVSDGQQRLRLQPMLPDRPLVVRPVVPIFVPPARSTTLYVSSPLWLRLFLGDESVPMFDEPVDRPSDTWFRSSPTRGTLCYASRTTAGLRLDAVWQLSHRAVVTILVENRSTSVLAIERMSVPVHELSISADDDGRLWTDRLELRQDDQVGAAVNVAPRQGTEAGKSRVADPRRLRSKGSLFEAFAGRLSGDESNG